MTVSARMMVSLWVRQRVVLIGLLSSLIVVSSGIQDRVQAHEVVPAIADMTQNDDTLTFVVTLNLEGVLAGIDLSTTSDTNDAPQAQDYDQLRAMDSAQLQAELAQDWPDIASGIRIETDDGRLAPSFVSAVVPEAGDLDLIRQSQVTFAVTLPTDTTSVTMGWAAGFGTLVLRQQGVDAPYTGYLEAGATSDPIALQGGGEAGLWATFFGYIPVGFDHIVPKGLDHILFVLGLFFLSNRLRPLLLQVSAFTVAHTITLALAALGYVMLPGAIVEPLIAASIVFVAVENIFTDGLSRWRPVVVFGFGLLHGLGFASVLGEFGLPQGAFVPALIGFNIGVEFGQLAVIAIAFALVGFWFGGKPWYRRVIAVPASCGIALMGGWWVIERTLL